MGTFLVTLFWLWLLISLSVYGYRLWRRVTRGSRQSAGEGDGTAAHPSTSTLPPLLTGPLPAPGEPGPNDPGPADPGSTTSGRTGLFAPTTPTTPESTPRPTVADAVQGISMPCGLTPVLTDTLDPHRVAFATSGVAPAVVAAGVADELERLGFAVRTVGDRDALATREGTEVTVTVHPDSTEFPDVPAGSIVVTLST